MDYAKVNSGAVTTTPKQKAKATAQKRRRVPYKPAAQERHRRSACRPPDLNPCGDVAYGFLKTRFLPHYIGQALTGGIRKDSFYRSFALLCNHYGINPVDTKGYAYPYSREVALHEAGRLLNQKYPQHIEMEVLEDNGNFIVQATETCYTGNTLFYIPVLPVYNMMQDKKHRKAARLLLCIFSYLYHTANIPYYTEDSFLYWQYEMVSEWVTGDPDDWEQKDYYDYVSQLRAALHYGETMLRRLWNTVHLDHFGEWLADFKSTDPFDKECHQNLIFLEDEEKTFKKVISQRILDRKKIFQQRDQLKDKISLFEKQLNHQTETYAGEEFAKLRERILQVDATFKEKEKYKRIAERWEALNPLRKEREKLKKQLEDLKNRISTYGQTDNDIKILKNIQNNFRKNVRELGLFKSNQQLISNIKIDAVDNYTPYLDNFDIYNISSSSDNIRIILSYYLSLLQTSIDLKSNEKIKFPNLLILDEPKQQNLDNASLINCIELIEKIPMTISQVMLTTYSELESDRERLQKYINYEMKSSTDYLLKKIKK